GYYSELLTTLQRNGISIENIVKTDSVVTIYNLVLNADFLTVIDKERYEVIAGVNIPMLVETFMARDDDPSFDELVALAVETGR
ncbi:PTS mannose transporter subunit IIAB, partial [Salmonella enterica subsp. enterica serovar Montevideo]|nr:PTS mannose transporter subunit IIAB [Salmonella enterica subsp. enterica serovar Montevideo]